MMKNRRTRRTVRRAVGLAAPAARWAWSTAQWLSMAMAAGILAALLTGCGGGDHDDDEESVEYPTKPQCPQHCQWRTGTGDALSGSTSGNPR